MRRGASMKTGCKFFIAFTWLDSDQKYRCSSINSQHQCTQDPVTWDRYAQYRTKDAVVQQQGVDLLNNGVKAGQAAAFLNSQYSSRVRPKDINRMLQTSREKAQSLSDCGLNLSECQRLLQQISSMGDRYRVKYQGDTQVMECIFYWDPTEVTLAQRFSQVTN